ncbi:MAG: diacylglycerol kinase family lipid kinase [Myxococcaceae bacterium]|nr:diacylglycerol kinase family lipid kinase [Myxococcaceae bacterium]
MKTFFVVNPKSANGSTGKRWGELAATIARTLSDFGVEFTQKPMDAARITTNALKAGYECVVAVGGDGTINEVTNGFFEGGRPLNPNAALGVLPRGTGGDFRKTFEWDTDFEQAVRRLKTPDTRPFDVGLCEYVNHEGRTETRYFANILSFGVSGLVDQEVARIKGFGGRLGFSLASLRALSKYRDHAVSLTLDGKGPERLPITVVAVGNGRFFGGGMKVTPNADVSDGLFDVTYWTGYGLSDFVFKQGGLYSGKHLAYAGTQTRQCRELRAEADGEVLIDCDGEQPGKLPCRVTMLPSAIRLKV